MRGWMAVALAVALIGLAGCTGGSSKKEADFRSVDASQEGADDPFELRVSVRGLGDRISGPPVVGNDEGVDPGIGSSAPPEDFDDTVPIPNAFVGVLSNDKPLAKATTDKDGLAVLQLRADQRIRLVGVAEGWTSEDSGVLAIGGSVEDGTCFRFTQGCVVTNGASRPEFTFGGTSADVALVLFRPTASVSYVTQPENHVNLGSVGIPDTKYWAPEAGPLSKWPELTTMYLERLQDVHAFLNWTNEIQFRADYALGVGCSKTEMAARTPEDAADNHLIEEGLVELDLAWTPPEPTDHWSTCTGLVAGPIVESLNYQVVANLRLDLTFVSKSEYDVQP